MSIAVAFAVGVTLAAKAISAKAKHNAPSKHDTYECGEEPDGIGWMQFHPRYYVIALVFVLFDVETVFILPWALNIEPLGVVAIVEMTIFITILMLGWGYALRKGALKWQ